jgi:RNA polymerase primary sigma factor
LARIKKDQDEVSLIESVKGEFAGSGDELLEDAISIADIDEVLEKLERSSVAGVETDEPLIEHDSSVATSDSDDEALSDEIELDLSAGELDKTSDPVRVYMREMGVVPLLTRQQEVAIAKRIEWGQKRAQKAISRSPIAVVELLKSMKTEVKSITSGLSKAFKTFGLSIGAR